MRFQRPQDEQEAVPPKIRVGCATGIGEDSFCIGAKTAREALCQVGEEPLSAVIVFAPVSYDLKQLLAGIHEVVGDVPVFGATSGGEICNGVYVNSVAVTILASPFLKVRLGLGERVSEDWQQAVRRAVVNDELRPFFTPDDNTRWDELIHEGKSAFAMLFSPGSTQSADSRGHEILEELRRLSLGRLPVFGGSAADWSMKANYVFAGPRAAPDSMIVAVFETSLRFGIAISHGLRPTSHTTIVTRASGHDVLELDGAPAADTYSRLSGIPRRALEKQDLPLIAGQPLGIRDSVGQYTVNMISCVTPEGAMRLAQPVSEGTTLTLMTLVPDEMIAAGEDAMRKAILRSSECDPAVTFTCDCVLRPQVLGDRAGEEIAAILRMTPNAPLVGFYSFGESGMSDDGANRHNNESISMLLLGRELSYAATVAQENCRLTEALTGANRALEISVREATAANDAAQAANKAKGQFLANMSHELRTPLNGVIGMTELLRGTELDEQQRGFVEACSSSGKVLLTLINDILDFSKIEAEKLELDERDFDLGRMVNETVKAMAIQARQKGIQLISHVAPPARLWVRGDDMRLRQVLVNLIGNAVKFTEVGEVAVKVELVEPQAGNPVIRFEVSDTGIGIPADRSERIFQSFSQADSSTTRKYGGTGLGLAISKSLVELMGGQIGVASQPGQGSTFWFMVPLRPASSERPEENDASEVSAVLQQTRDLRLKGFRVLLAEDNHVNRMYVQEVLWRSGMECHAVENGIQAIQAVQSERFDLALMDCQMPEMDGFEATRRIRDGERGGQLAGHLPVIALTANAIKGDRENCLQAGMDSYIGKPFEPGTLLEMIARFLLAKQGKPAEEPPVTFEQTPSSADGLPPIDGDALLARCMGDLEFAQALLSDFQGDLLERVDRIARHIRQCDAQATVKLAHALKGVAGTITAEPLRALAAKIEAAGKAGDLTPVASLTDQLRAEAQRCLRCIPELREQMNIP